MGWLSWILDYLLFSGFVNSVGCSACVCSTWGMFHWVLFVNAAFDIQVRIISSSIRSQALD